MKVRFGQDIRRVSILTDDIAYIDLCFTLSRLFSTSQVKLDVNDLLLKYRDEEGDFVSLKDDWDAKQASIQQTGFFIELSLKANYFQLESSDFHAKVQTSIDQIQNSLNNLKELVQTQTSPKNVSQGVEMHRFQTLTAKDLDELLE